MPVPGPRTHPISAVRVPGLDGSTGQQSSAPCKEFCSVLELGATHGETLLILTCGRSPHPELTRAFFPLLPNLHFVRVATPPPPLFGPPDPGPGLLRADLTGAQAVAAERAFRAPPELPWSARPPPRVLQAPAPGLIGVTDRPGCGPNLGGAGSVLRDRVRMGSSNLRPRGEYFVPLPAIPSASPSPRSSRARLCASVSAARIV